MSWTNIGAPVELEPGQSAFWEYSWENSKDMGLELAGPNITEVDPSTLGTLVASNQGKFVVGGTGGGGSFDLPLASPEVKAQPVASAQTESRERAESAAVRSPPAPLAQ
jgi:hypothetical protein